MLTISEKQSFPKKNGALYKINPFFAKNLRNHPFSYKKIIEGFTR